MHVLLPIHIAAGALAVVLGFTALFVKKGGTIHRRSGLLFVYAMLVMGITASILEFLKSAAATNVVAALMALYFVGTALTTVRPASRWTRVINVAALAVAVGLAVLSIVGGVKAVSTPGLSGGRVPFRTIGVMSFILAAVLLLSAAGDLRIMRSGMPRGGPRLARHLWRMCFALFIAAGSFFSIRSRVAKILPDPFTTGWMRALPILLLFGAMFYWLWRVRRRPTGILPVMKPTRIWLFVIAFLCIGTPVMTAEERAFDPELAKRLGADERGMKMYVLCILKTGPKDAEIKGDERKEIFAGHFANIGRLADEGKLAVAGPFGKNDKAYRGLYIFNVATIEEAEKLVMLDPAVKAGVFVPDLTLWYGSAAMMVVSDTHKKIEKPKS